MKRLQYSAACLVLAILGSTFAGAVMAQRQPVGSFDWEARDGDVKVGGEYLFAPGGRYRMTVAGIKPPVTYVGRWEMRQDTVVVYAQDGGEQTYRWEGGDLVLVGNTTGLPAGKIVLRHRARSAPPVTLTGEHDARMLAGAYAACSTGADSSGRPASLQSCLPAA